MSTHLQQLPGGVPITGISRVDGLCARLLAPGELERLTDRRSVDARTALARGLAEYLGPLQLIWEGGRRAAFEAVHVQWAEPERPAAAPALVVVDAAPGQYADTFGGVQLSEIAPGMYLTGGQPLEQKFHVGIWARDPEERAALVSMFDDAFVLEDGLRLVLPYYFGVVASYSVRSIAYADDSASEAARRWRLARYEIDAGLQLHKPPVALPKLKASVRTEVDDVSDVMLE